MIVPQAFDEIAGDELDVIEFCKIENMRFGQNGRRDIQRLTDLRQIVEKMRIGQFFGIFVYELFTDLAVRHQLSPNSHIRIIHESEKKVKRFNGSNRLFFDIR